MEQESQEEVSARERPRPVPRAEVPGLHRRVEGDGREVLRVQPDRERPAVLALVKKGSMGEGPNHSNYSDQSSVSFLSELRRFR